MSTTRYVSWSLHTKSRSSLKSMLSKVCGGGGRREDSVLVEGGFFPGREGGYGLWSAPLRPRPAKEPAALQLTHGALSL